MPIASNPIPAIPETYSPEAIAEAWMQCKEALPVEVKATNPWSVAIKLMAGDSFSPSPGERAAWRIASNYNAAHRQGGNTWWHMSGAALTIWITRQWSVEQIGATLVRDSLCP